MHESVLDIGTMKTISKMHVSRVEKLVAENKISAKQVTADGVFRIKWLETGYICKVQVFGV